MTVPPDEPIALESKEPAATAPVAEAAGLKLPGANGRIVHSDNLAVLKSLQDGCADLIYIDPPFNTGKMMERRMVKAVRCASGKLGFHGTAYNRIDLGGTAFGDRFDDFIGFLEPRLVEARRILADHGTLYFHIDYREVHYCKVLLDRIFSRRCFLNEVIWAYDYGARTKSKWPPKHDNILVYVKHPAKYRFDTAAVDRIPYLAPELVGAEKAARGKLPTDTWWHTIVPTNGREKTGYPTQKPMGILRRIITASSRAGDLVVDFFAGSGTTGAAALELGRRFLLVDDNPEAIEVMRKRFAGHDGVLFEDAASRGRRPSRAPRKSAARAS
jgi:site-specific DNA-methyltransferase (adenine-specific)